MDPTITSQYVQVDDLKIHYLSAGEGDTILCLHGWPTSAYLWRNIMPEVAANHRIIAMDLPGYGKSDKRLEDSFSFRYYNRAIDGLLIQLGIEKITLCVHDVGGPLGLYWAVKNPTKVDRLILMNTLVYPDFSWGVKLFGLATMMPGLKNWLTSHRGLKGAMSFGVHQKEKLSPEAIQLYQAPFKDKNSRAVLLKAVQRLSKKGFEEIEQLLPQFKGAVLILYGANDRILPKVKNTMERVKTDLPQAQIITYPNCGHFLQEEEPERIGQDFVAFLKDN